MGGGRGLWGGYWGAGGSVRGVGGEVVLGERGCLEGGWWGGGVIGGGLWSVGCIGGCWGVGRSVEESILAWGVVGLRDSITAFVGSGKIYGVGLWGAEGICRGLLGGGGHCEEVGGVIEGGGWETSDGVMGECDLWGVLLGSCRRRGLGG